MINHIGGYFELEKFDVKGDHYHSDALRLHTGRACIRHILSETKPNKVFVPKYLCQTALQPFIELNIDFTLYSVNYQMLPEEEFRLGKNDYLFVTSYFGVNGSIFEELCKKYVGNLIIDDTHSFFVGRRLNNWSFTSARKYFGVPDGAYLYSPKPLSTTLESFEGSSIEHMALRSLGLQSEGFRLFQKYEKSLGSSTLGMSKISDNLLKKVDYNHVKRRRRENFEILHAALHHVNKIKIENQENEVPFCYPFLPKNFELSHDYLYSNGIYPPKFWTDALVHRLSKWEKILSTKLLPLPIDHRYGPSEMNKILSLINHTEDHF